LVCIGPICDHDGRASTNLAGLQQLLADRGLGEASVGVASCVRRHCLGNCRGEPLAQVLPDDIWYHRLTAENLLRIYAQHVLERRPIIELALHT
jgi:(2Fe-2S) ferredoxin